MADETKRRVGRPRKNGERGQPRTIYLTDSDWRELRAVGKGNASEGVRRGLLAVGRA